MRTALDVAATDAADLPPQDSRAARALDAAATAELGLPSILLMENAARAVAAEAHAMTDGPVLILAGRGNNGGDGLAVARWLAPRARVTLLGEPDPARSPDAALQLDVLRRAGIAVHVGRDPAALAEGVRLIVDALFGTGLSAAPAGSAADWIQQANAHEAPVLAVDLPSGLDADTGEAYEPCIRAACTVTFARPKRGLLEADGPARAGRVVVASLGLPEPWVAGRDD